MLFRAVFWIGLISVIMPREPDVGYGSPGPAANLTSGITAWMQSRITTVPSADIGTLTVLHADRNLAQVKAEIAAALRPS